MADDNGRAALLSECRQPPGACTDAYCLCIVYRDAKQRCIDRGEGWRWGIGQRA